MATVDDLRDFDLSGGFAALSDGQIQTYLDFAALQIDAETWGDCYDTAQILLASHNMAVTQSGSSGGPITSASGGGLSVGYGSAFGTGGPNASLWNATGYGRQLTQLARACGIVAIDVVVGTSLS
jgi:hypothetical protein